MSILTEPNALNGAEQLNKNISSSGFLLRLTALVKAIKRCLHLTAYSKQSSIHGGTSDCVMILQHGYIDRQAVYIIIHGHEVVLSVVNTNFSLIISVILLFASV